MPKARRLPLHVLISLLFGSLLLLSGFVLGVFHYRQASQIIYDSSAQLSGQIQQAVEMDLHNTFMPIRRLLRLMAQAPPTLGRDLDQRLPLVRPFSQALRDNHKLDSLYIGYPDGDFFMVRPLRDPHIRTLLDAPEDARFQVWSIDRIGNRTVAEYLFFNDALNIISRVPLQVEHYDPRGRNWFTAAQDSTQIIITEPYVFYSTRQVGTTLALSLHHEAVLAADLTLADLSATLARHNVTPDTQLVLYDRQGRAVAYPNSSLMVDEASDELIPARRLSPGLAALFDMPTLTQGRLGLAGREWLVSRTHIAEGGPQGLNLAILVPEDQLLADAYRIRWHSALITLGVTALGVLLAWLASRLVVLPLRSLARSAEAIGRFDFNHAVENHSPVLEIDQLARVMRLMRNNLAGFLEISDSLAAETRYEALLERVLREILGIGGADAGVLYLRNAENDRLEPQGWLLRDSHDPPVRGGLLTYPNTASAPIWLRQPAEGGESLLIALGYEQAGDLRELMERLDCRQLQLLCIGLHNRQGETLGVLILLNRITGAESDPTLLQPSRIAFVEAISGAAALSIETQRLLDNQKKLLEAFIQVIAGAIDAKSAYTGGHCQRVPELTLMLARAAAASHEPPFVDYRPTPEDWEALHIAAWLHDCGKVTTPEYVVDKSTKLETLYNRIHEIRTRFEVLKRDAWIAYWHGLAEGGDATTLAAARDRQLAELDDDFAFVARCNLGSESMAEDDLPRLQRIARRRWLRTLDDRLGLSWEEAQRKARQPAPTLPVEEQLLADRPDHLIERPEAENIEANNPWGFQMRVPEYKFNLGELHCLSVRHGTLTEEERYLIKHHIVQTLIMLKHLPFPPHLRDVPDIAGSHHERMDGNGYPRRLRADQLSLPARMMAIADVFEALTAVDRPYKRGKTLSESLMLMANMCRNGHIDPDLFRLFVESNMPRRYAERFLAPEQIDEVDRHAVLSRAGIEVST